LRDSGLTLYGGRGPRYRRHGHPSLLIRVFEGCCKLKLRSSDPTDARARSTTTLPGGRLCAFKPIYGNKNLNSRVAPIASLEAHFVFLVVNRTFTRFGEPMCSSHAINRNFFRKTLGDQSILRAFGFPTRRTQRREEAVAADDRSLSAAANSLACLSSRHIHVPRSGHARWRC
jgi:hypothetical protein